jgi:hypothetical protein
MKLKNFTVLIVVFAFTLQNCSSTKVLNAWKAELMSEVDRTLNTMQDESSALPDVNDRATQEEEFAIVFCSGQQGGMREATTYNQVIVTQYKSERKKKSLKSIKKIK